MFRPRSLSLLLLLNLLLAFAAAAEEVPKPPAAPRQPKEYSQLWVDKTAVVTPREIADTVAGVKTQQADPQHIVIFVHGFDVERDSSTAEFDGLATRLREEFAKSKTRAAFVGLQWESAAQTSIINLDAAYFSKIPLARSVGHGPARALIFALHKAYPKANVSVFGHSMGCEVLAAAAVPEIKYADNPAFVETAQPAQSVKLLMAVFCGSDLDYDIWAKSQVVASKDRDRVKLMWQTVAPYLGKGDKVLSLRGRIRGKAAGMAFPKMTLAQIDEICSKRRVIFDGENIPTSHDFNEYYNQARVARLVPALLYAANPSLPKPAEIAEVDAILAAPADVSTLLPYLDSGHYGTMFYTLWRLERINCGDARHMTDGTLEAIAHLLRDKAQMIWRQQETTKCVTVKKGQFPTARMMTRRGAPPKARKT